MDAAFPVTRTMVRQAEARLRRDQKVADKAAAVRRRQVLEAAAFREAKLEKQMLEATDGTLQLSQ